MTAPGSLRSTGRPHLSSVLPRSAPTIVKFSVPAPNPILKEPIISTNRLYYNLQLFIAPWDALDAAAIQHLILMEFIKLLCLVDKTTVILPYKIFFAVKGDVLFEPEKLGQLYMAVSKYF